MDEGSWSAPKRIAVMLAFVTATVGVVVLAWRSMNAGTLICFGLVIAWIIYQEWSAFRLADSLSVAEFRIRALEEYAGIRRAYCDEVKAAEEVRRMFGGGLASAIHWPGVDYMAQWRRQHWEEWSARWATAANAGFNAIREAPIGADIDALGQSSERTLTKVWEQRPYLPPPEGNGRAYWSDANQWQPQEGDYLPNDDEADEDESVPRSERSS